MDLGLKGRTAIVSGASSGLGLATAEALAGEGANVTMFARRREVLEREADRIGALAVRGDVTNPRELGPQGVTVNCVAPGRIDTARLAQLYPDGPSEADLSSIPLGRWGTPQEFGDVACFLASDRARYVTGATVVVDGGLTRGLL